MNRRRPRSLTHHYPAALSFLAEREACTFLIRLQPEPTTMSDRPDPDPDRVQENAKRRQHERTEHVEKILSRADDLLGEQKYPTTSEELATEYADEPLDLPNETESLGSVFDRLVDERFETPEDAREALYRELTGPAGPNAEYNEERDLQQLDESVQDEVTDSGSSDM